MLSYLFQIIARRSVQGFISCQNGFARTQHLKEKYFVFVKVKYFFSANIFRLERHRFKMRYLDLTLNVVYISWDTTRRSRKLS